MICLYRVFILTITMGFNIFWVLTVVITKMFMYKPGTIMKTLTPFLPLRATHLEMMKKL